MYGREFVELLDILAKYQLSRPKENSLLDAACTFVDSTCDLYNIYIASYWLGDVSKLNEILPRIRTALSEGMRLFLKTCLSGRRADWFPAFLYSCLAICGVLMLTDIAAAVPEPARALLWGDVPTLGNGLRANFYSLVLDLLCANGNGSHPLMLSCWALTEEVDCNGQISQVRNPEGMKLAGQDAATFDGFRSLQGWLRRNSAFLKLGELWYASDLYTWGTLPPTSSMARLFRP